MPEGNKQSLSLFLSFMKFYSYISPEATRNKNKMKNSFFFCRTKKKNGEKIFFRSIVWHATPHDEWNYCGDMHLLRHFSQYPNPYEVGRSKWLNKSNCILHKIFLMKFFSTFFLHIMKIEVFCEKFEFIFFLHAFLIFNIDWGWASEQGMECWIRNWKKSLQKFFKIHWFFIK